MDIDVMVGSGLKVRCERDALVAGLSLVSRATSTRGTVHVLAGILLQGSPGKLDLAATDMELSLRTSVPAEVEGNGAVVVPGKLLLDLARLLPVTEVTLEYKPEEGVFHVSSGEHTSRVHVYAAEDFPRLPSVDVSLHDVDGPALVKTVERVSRAASRDESRPVLTGIFVRFEGETLIMAATDSYRLAVKETVLTEAGPELEAIIPARGLAEMARIAAGATTVRVGVHENHVVFSAENAWLTSRRIDGQFPNYKQLIPESFDAELTLPRLELLEVVRRAAVMAQRNTPLRLRFADGALAISAQSQDIGDATESLPVAYTGEPLEIGFNAEFLREGLEAIIGDDVTLKLINPLRPGLLTADGDAFWYLIMPIRLAG